ncbi:nitronate monooxygenase [Nocardiopsis ansamitocini]|uniref:Propionate 3-nitronate monooxygenase n=1 Tax=Nocardiopsis ansamitocini TaxID=1670832 RepID=A0A9W6UHE5_9ACTN|nr:nitronate monooxygenase [Nocardiopsis ansamitocini]GLU48781.1 oxidoreductase [Nocardiopsis ansamitocini]
MQELSGLAAPVVVAPMAGGASTPELVAAAASAGGLGFLAAGYATPADMVQRVRRTRELGAEFFGVNLFVPGPDTADPVALAAYRYRIAADAARLGVRPGEPRWDDDAFAAKLDLLLAEPVPVVSCTFGPPPPGVADRLRRAGTLVVGTVTDAAEARLAVDAGAHALCVQGAEAGGHQGSFDDARERTAPLAEVLAAVRAAVDVPLIAAGGLTRAADVRAVLAAGATAAQLGTLFLRTPESGANPVHRAALADPRFTATAVTRAFTGRRARGLVNGFLTVHDPLAPAGYPQVHHLTAPLRAAAVRAGDAETAHLWAGTGYRAAPVEPAARVIASLTASRQS